MSRELALSGASDSVARVAAVATEIRSMGETWPAITGAGQHWKHFSFQEQGPALTGSQQRKRDLRSTTAFSQQPEPESEFFPRDSKGEMQPSQNTDFGFIRP